MDGGCVRSVCRPIVGPVVRSVIGTSGPQAWSPSRLGSDVLQWSLDGGSAYGTAIDSYEVLRSLESYGTFRKPRAGRCGLFDGNNDYAISGSNVAISGDAAFTICAWVKASALADGTAIVAGGNFSGALAGFGLFLHSTGAFGGQFGGGNPALSTASQVSTGTWVHLAIVKTAGPINTTTTLYKNGVAVSLAVGASTSTPSITAAPIQVGAYKTNAVPGGYLSGRVSDPRLYSSAKSAAEIEAIYNQSDTPETVDRTGLLGGWWLNEEAGTVAYDWSGNGKHLTLTNITTSTFHAADTGVTYNPANWLGFTLSGSAVIPRNEASPTLDAAGNALGNTGRCPHPQVVETRCITGDGTGVYGSLGAIGTDSDFTAGLYYYHASNAARERLVDARNDAADYIWALAANTADGATITAGHLYVQFAGADPGLTLASALTLNAWHYITLSRAGDTWTLTCLNVSTGSTQTLSKTKAMTFDSAADFYLIGGYNNAGSAGVSLPCNGRLAMFSLLQGGVTTYFPLQDGPGSSNTNRDLSYVKSDGTYGVVSGAIVNGTVSTIWSNRCPGYAQDWCVQYGGTLDGNGVFVPGQISGTLAADGSTKNLTAGKHGNPYSRISPNPWNAPELRAIGHTPTTLYAPGDDQQSVSPADTKFRRTDTDGDDRFFAVSTALTGSNKTNAEAYVQ